MRELLRDNLMHVNRPLTLSLVLGVAQFFYGWMGLQAQSNNLVLVDPKHTDIVMPIVVLCSGAITVISITVAVTKYHTRLTELKFNHKRLRRSHYKLARLVHSNKAINDKRFFYLGNEMGIDWEHFKRDEKAT